MVWSVKRLEMYLRGLRFYLLTDHQPLKVLFGTKQKPCRRIERCALRLQSFRFRIVHIAGKANIADPLSRLPEFQECTTYDEYGESMLLAIVETARLEALTMGDIVNYTLKDEELVAVKKALISGQWTDAIKRYVPFRNELMAVNEIIVRGERLVIPKNLRKKVLEIAHIGHPGIERTKQRLRAKVWWPNLDKETLVKIRELPQGPYLSMDMLGPLPSGESLLVVIDLYSPFRVVEVLRQTTTTDILKKLKPLFMRLGFPDTLLTDNATNFSSREMMEFCNLYGSPGQKK